jgi:hypothetical protein
MKLTVGRIVHAHAATFNCETGHWNEPGEQPYAGIVTLVAETAAYIRILDPAGKNFDMTVKVSLSPDSQRTPSGDGWVWRWPPREE